MKSSIRLFSHLDHRITHQDRARFKAVLDPTFMTRTRHMIYINGEECELFNQFWCESKYSERHYVWSLFEFFHELFSKPPNTMHIDAWARARLCNGHQSTTIFSLALVVAPVRARRIPTLKIQFLDQKKKSSFSYWSVTWRTSTFMTWPMYAALFNVSPPNFGWYTCIQSNQNTHYAELKT